MSLKLAIWDMDGTIVDSRHVISAAMDTAFETMGLDKPGYERTRTIVGLDLNVACRALAPEDISRDMLGNLVTAYKEAFIRQRGDSAFEELLYEGALQTLENLQAEGWLQAVATGKSRRGVEAIFKIHPIADYFDTVWCADDGPGKPNPFMVEQAMGAVGAEPHKSLMIGDSVFDMQMGRAAKVKTLGVSWGFGTAEELTPFADEVHHTFATLDESLAKRR